MQKLFAPDGGFSHFTARLSQLVWLNILSLVCSLPVVTFGASSAALYTVLLHLLQGEDGHLPRRFFAAWRDNWKRASGCWLLLLNVIAVCGADLWLAQTGNRFIWKVLAVFALQLVGMVMTFLFPLLARYENTWRRQLSNALMLGVGNLPKLLLMWLYWGAAFVLTALTPTTLYMFLPVWLLVGYAALSYANLKLIWPIFNRIEEQQRREKEEQGKNTDEDKD